MERALSENLSKGREGMPLQSRKKMSAKNCFDNGSYHNTTLPRCPKSILAVVAPRALKTFTMVA